MNRNLLALAILASFLILSCSPRPSLNNELMDSPSPLPDFSAGPPTIVYKTKKDYRHQVPVILSKNKSTIVSYPDPADVLREEPSPYPTQLRNG